MSVEAAPVQVRFSGVATPDMATLNASLLPYARLSDAQIAAVLPVEVSWPKIVADRIGVLERYGAGDAPAGTAHVTVASVRKLVSGTLAGAADETVRAVRLMAAAAIRDDGSRAVTVRSAILATYLEAKALAMVRTLGNYVLTTEPSIDWGDEFSGLGHVFSPDIIYGLALLTRSFGSWAGWTDADLFLQDRRHRIWVPILAEAPDHRADRSFTIEEIQFLFVPQLLDKWQPTFEEVRAIAFGPWTFLRRGLILRDEQFIDRDSCVDESSSGPAIARIAAEKVLRRLINTPVTERARMRVELVMTMRSHGVGFHERLCELEAAVFGAAEGGCP